MADIKVIEVDPVTYKVSIKFSSRLVEGMDLLVQLVILRLLTTPGSDLFDEAIGGGFSEMIGMNHDPSDLSEVYSEVARKVSKAQQELISEQVGLDLLAEEKLLQITIVSLTPGAEIDEVNIRLRIENEVGRTRDVVI